MQNVLPTTTVAATILSDINTINNANYFLNDMNYSSAVSGVASVSKAFPSDDDFVRDDEKISATGTISHLNATSIMSWVCLRGGEIQIPFYTIILLLGIVGNLLVISTLVQNRRMRTITNLFLLNLAFSDILLGVLCMPVTLVGTLLRHFIFGAFLCKLIPFLQATSVAVSSWTLVAISCERYYAICHPLRSRTWQTISHAYKMIGFIWMGSIMCMAPIAVFSQLMPTNQGLRKCREQWPKDAIVYERTYNILLDLILLVLPLILLCAAYILITRTLYRSIKMERNNVKGPVRGADIIMESEADTATGTNTITLELNASISSVSLRCQNGKQHLKEHQQQQQQKEQQSYDEIHPKNKIFPNPGKAYVCSRPSSIGHFGDKCTNVTSHHFHNVHHKHELSTPETVQQPLDSILRRSNTTKTLESKRRVVKMLFVLVLEFFICWTPLYVINTITLFDAALIYHHVGYTAISFLQLLAYSSSCCNPITYCFMNAGFRRAFLDTFKGLHLTRRLWWKPKSSSTGSPLA